MTEQNFFDKFTSIAEDVTHLLSQHRGIRVYVPQDTITWDEAIELNKNHSKLLIIGLDNPYQDSTVYEDWEATKENDNDR